MNSKKLDEYDNGIDAQGDELADLENDGIELRPDGFYWRALDGRQEFGPFDSLELARLDQTGSTDDSLEPSETLQEAESEIGIAGWIDPETGDPAYGLSPPHLDKE
jgi:hypothetical protein